MSVSGASVLGRGAKVMRLLSVLFLNGGKRCDARLPFGVVSAGKMRLALKSWRLGQCRALTAGKRLEQAPGRVVVFGDGRGQGARSRHGRAAQECVEHLEREPLSAGGAVDRDLPDKEPLGRIRRSVG